MQVFKSFFKILNKHKGQMLLYLCIFIGIISVLSANNAFNNTSSYETTKPRFAVFDYDNSVESHALTGYLSKTCTKTDIKNDKPLKLNIKTILMFMKQHGSTQASIFLRNI